MSPEIPRSGGVCTSLLLITLLATTSGAAQLRHVELTPVAGQLVVGAVDAADRTTGGIALPVGSVDPFGQTAAALVPPLDLGLDLPEVQGLLLPRNGEVGRRAIAPVSRRYPSAGGQARTVAFAAAASSVAEDAGAINVAVELVTSDGLASATAITVEVTTVDGSAIAGDDYLALAGAPVTFPAGSASGATTAVPVTILDDGQVEGDESFDLALANPTGSALGSPAIHNVTILDDEDGVVWLGGNGSWSDGSSWQGGVPPGPGDIAVIIAEGAYTVTLDVDASVAALVLGSGNPASQPTLDTTFRRLTLAGPSTVATGATLWLASGGALDGAGDLTVEGELRWTRGRMSGAGRTVITAGATATISNLAGPLERVLESSGTVAISSNLQITSSGVIVNRVGGLLDLAGDISVGLNGLGELITNEGLLVKSSGAGTTTITARVDSSGTVEVLSGTLELRGGGTSTGAFQVPAGTTLQLGAGTQLQPFSSVTGDGNGTFSTGGGSATVLGAWTLAGTTSISIGRARFNGPATTFPHLVVDGGTLDGSADLTVTGTLDWSWGRMEGTGSTLLASGAVATVRDNAGPLLRVLDSSGTVTITSSLQITETGGIVNRAGGLLDLAGDVNLGVNGLGEFIANAGTMAKSTGAGVASLRVDLTNTGRVEVTSGTLRMNGRPFVQTAGVTLVDGTVLESTTHPLAVQGGLLGGSGTVAANVSNTGGIVAPGLSPGVLTVDGDYTQGAGGTLEVEIQGLTPGSEFDRLQITGTATLAGELAVALLSPYEPSPGESFEILSAAAVTGAFDPVTTTGAPAGTTADATSTATAVTVTFDLRPEISIDDVTVIEGDDGAVDAVLTVALSAEPTDAVTVDWATADGTASSGSDYVAASGTVTFTPPSVTETITVQVLGDTVAEDHETFVVDLIAPAGATLGDDRGEVTILDDDLVPVLTLRDTELCEASPRTVVFSLRLDRRAQLDVEIDFRTLDGTAGAGDYLPVSGTLHIPAGSTRAYVKVHLLDDALVEGHETFALELLHPVNAILDQDLGDATILDDDAGGAPGDADGNCRFDSGDLFGVIWRIANPVAPLAGNPDCTGDGLVTTVDLSCLVRSRVFGR